MAETNTTWTRTAPGLYTATVGIEEVTVERGGAYGEREWSFSFGTYTSEPYTTARECKTRAEATAASY